MCIGIPMRVIEPGEGTALCEGRGERRRVSTLLVGDQPAGAWLLEFLGCAREVLDAREARRIDDALDALELVMSGRVSNPRELDRYFSDLVAPQGEATP